ncbi:autotransporter domain-containing protein [Escherichia coli]|nr:AIDA repeat-containing protein [Escherichia coli]MWE19696.1 autotransporter domain-containing protein [Escherichia coli]
MKRHLNTCYRLVWNHITGAFVVASELARARGKRGGVAVALSLAAVTSLPVLAADIVVHPGETVNGGTLVNHDNQFVSGTADGVTVSTGLELGPDSDDNTGGQQIARGGTARNTTVTANGLQDVMAGGSATDTVISAGGGQNLRGQAYGTVLNGGEQWIHAGGSASGTVINQSGYQTIKHGGQATGTIVNTGAEGGPESENVSSGQMVGGTAESTTINKNGRQVIWSSGMARDTLIYAGGDQTVHGEAHNTRLEGGNQYVHKYGLALNTVINEGGWQVIKEGGTTAHTTINQKGKLQVNAGGKASDVTQNTGGALVTSTAATVTGTNRLYASMLTQAMDYDRILAGSRSHQTGVNGENNSVRLSIQGGHLGHDNNGGIARGATPESSGSYGFVRLEGDLLRTEVAGMSLTTGVYGAAGHSSVDVKDDDGSRAGTVRDDAGSLGGYMNLTHTSSGLWADIVAQGTRHSMKASSGNNDFRARGWGWLGSLETGLPFSITDNLMLEPRLQYTWQGLSLDDGKDNAGYVKFGHGSAQHVRAGFRLGSHNDMTFGEGTSSRAPLRDSAKHSVRELPVNWWVQPSVIRTFSSRGDMRVGTSTAGSGMTFSPSQNGTSLDLQAGLEARVRENITLGVQAGYAHSVSGSSAEGYNSQATLNVTF